MTEQVETNFKEPKPDDNPAYLRDVRVEPCCICEAFGEVQMSPTTAHHPIHDRQSGAKRPDITAIPLCDGHHQGTFDTSKLAIHRAPEQWRDRYGADTDYITPTQDRLCVDRYLISEAEEG